MFINNTIHSISPLLTLSIASGVLLLSSCSCGAFSFRPNLVGVTRQVVTAPLCVVSSIGTATTSSRSSSSLLHMTSLVVPMPTIVDLTPGIEAVDALNSDFEVLLAELREESFFRLYSVDMMASCEYMPQQLFECYTASCEIYAVEEDDDNDNGAAVPEYIRTTDAEEHNFELDGWARWDMPTEDYYDTSQFPEEYTGYDGSTVWRFIHDRICFTVDETHPTMEAESWQEDFNKAVCGMHGMISAQVVRGIDDKIKDGRPLEGEWTDPVIEFQRRLSPTGENRLALENMYFGYMLLLSAVRVARDRYLSDCDTGKIDAMTADKLRKVLDSPLLVDAKASSAIGVAATNLHGHATKDSNALWEARMRMRDLYRIMNCVQCNKCRLHAKLSAMGLSTAFQILLGRSGEGGDPTRVHRVELAALMSTLSKFSTSIKFCSDMMEKS